MNTPKEITLKEWSAYLPYGLKAQLVWDKSEDFEWQDWASDLSKFEKGAVWKLCGYAEPDLNIPLGEGEFSGWLWRNGNTYVNFHSGIKPILRDLSDLTKEIEHDGEKFVPIERLLDIESGINWSSSDYLLAESGVGEYWVKLKGKKKSFVFGFNCYKKYFYMHSQFGDNKYVKNQLQLFNRLFEWKFNVFQLPDELIVKVTEDFNPYK